MGGRAGLNEEAIERGTEGSIEGSIVTVGTVGLNEGAIEGSIGGSIEKVGTFGSNEGTIEGSNEGSIVMDGTGGMDVGSIVSNGPGVARRGNPEISRATTVPDKVNKIMANGSSERVFIANAIDGAVLLPDQTGKRCGREAARLRGLRGRCLRLLCPGGKATIYFTRRVLHVCSRAVATAVINLRHLNDWRVLQI